MSYIECIPKQFRQCCAQMSIAAAPPDLIMFEHDDNLVLAHETLGLQARRLPTLKKVLGAYVLIAE